MSEIIRFVLSAFFMILGVGAILLSVLGVFKFHFVMNRMHCAAITDTMGALCVLLSLAIASGSVTTAVKIAITLCLVWVGSPLSSHLIGRMEVSTDAEIQEHMWFKEGEEHQNDELV